jgi:N-methylhydantoinase B
LTQQKFDAITFELVKNGLESVVDEMALTIVRTAYSNVVRDNMDFSTGFCDATGQLVAQGLTIPQHLGSVPHAMAVIQERFTDGVFPGDVFLLNDPYGGGIHLPDLVVIKPVFVDGVLTGYAVTVMHHTDIGGRVPGGNASDSTEVYQEGLRIPAVRLYDRGVANESLFRVIEHNVRVPRMVLGDLRAQLAACHVGELRYAEMLATYGRDVFTDTLSALLDYSERSARSYFAGLPDGTYGFQDWIEGDGISSEPVSIRVAVTVRGSNVSVDFAGSSPQVRGAINSPLSSTQSAVFAALRCLLESSTPNNAGMFRPIRVLAPEGSVVNPRLPAAVAARGVTSFRIGDAVLGAMAQVAPNQVFAAGEGGNTGISLGGYYQDGNPFVYVEFLCGTWGARAAKDGVDGVTNIFSDLSNSPVEMTETEHPLVIDRYEYVPDSGGPGRFRGGLGIRKDFVFTEETGVLQVRSDRARFPPYGLFGGGSGGPTRNKITSPGGEREMPTKFTVELHRGDVFSHRQAGGGGYGEPMERDPDSVADDVRNGKVSAESAARQYGVVLAAGVVDPNATAARRSEQPQPATGVVDEPAGRARVDPPGGARTQGDD